MKIITCLLVCILGNFTVSFPQDFEVTTYGKITATISSKQNSFTVRYNALSGDANLLISFPFKNILPSDYSISWNSTSSSHLPDYRIYIKDESGTFWKGMKKFSGGSKKSASISKVHFGRPTDQGFIFPQEIDTIYISVPVSNKGKGSLTFSEFHLEEVYLTAKREMMPVVLTKTGKDIASLLLDNDPATFHTFSPGKNQLHLNYHNPRSPGGIFLQRSQSSDLTVTVYRKIGKKKKLLTEAVGSRRSKIYIPLPEHESSEYIVEFLSKYQIDLSEVLLLPEEANDHPVHLHTIMVDDTLKGYYPRGYSGSPSPQTTTWKNGNKAVYMNNDGQIELPHAGVMIDPFLRILDETGTYLTAKNHVRYSPDSSRVFHVNRAYQLGELWIRAFVDTVNSTPYLNILLEASNRYHFKIKGKVYAAIRPLGSDPYSATDLRSSYEPGIFSASLKDSFLTINKNQKVYLLTEPQNTPGYPFLKHEYISALNGEDTYPTLPLTDRQGLGTVLLSYDFTLIPASRRILFLSLPLENEKYPLPVSYKNLEQRMRPYLPQ